MVVAAIRRLNRMDGQDHLAFLIAVGESFCDALSDEPGFEDASPHDFQEVLRAAVGDPLTPEILSSTTSGEYLAKIVAECVRCFEVDLTATAKVEQALGQSLFRWPVGDH